MSVRVFCSYAHSDEDLKNELLKSLSAMRHEGLITGWDDRQLQAGDEWESRIDAEIRNADLILLLISPDFMASRYCYNIELTNALTQVALGKIRVVPIILRYVDVQGSPIERLQALPRDSLPITAWTDRDSAYLDVARGLRRVVADLTKKLSYQQSLDLTEISPPSIISSMEIDPVGSEVTRSRHAQMDEHDSEPVKPTVRAFDQSAYPPIIPPHHISVSEWRALPEEVQRLLRRIEVVTNSDIHLNELENGPTWYFLKWVTLGFMGFVLIFLMAPPVALAIPIIGLFFAPFALWYSYKLDRYTKDIIRHGSKTLLTETIGPLHDASENWERLTVMQEIRWPRALVAQDGYLFTEKKLHDLFLQGRLTFVLWVIATIVGVAIIVWNPK